MQRVLAIAVTLACMAPTLAAQTIADMCRKLGDVTVGQWVQYQMTASDIPGGQAEMRFAIVGIERAEGAEHYWFELKMNTSEGDFISQFLVPEYPWDQDEIKAAVIKAGNQPAMKLPAQMLTMMQQRGNNNQAVEWSKKCEAAEEVGWESITVPVGTMRTLHLRATDKSGEMWVTDALPFGMVKWVGTKGEEMVMTAHGKDAKSSITETPQEMPGMGMPPPE